MAYEKGKLYQIPIDDFRNDPNQPRKVFDPDALAELAESVRKHGILQPVLFIQGVTADDPPPEIEGHDPNSPELGIVSPNLQGTLMIVAGERRIEAARQAGLKLIPAIAVEGNASEIALVENLLRQDLTAVEEAEALQRLMDERQYNQEQLAGIIGKARQTITDILTLNRLPQTIRDECRGDRKISRATLIEIARKKQARAMETAFEKYKEKLRKQAEGRQKRTTKEETAEDILQWLVKANQKLLSVTVADWTEDQKGFFLEELTELQETIQGLLNPPPSTAKTATKAAKKDLA